MLSGYWETISGSYVKGVVDKKVTVDPSAIQWLLLKATESGGPGVLNGVTYIQRVNTTEGLAPADPAALAAAVVDLLADPAAARRLGQMAAASMCTRFRWEVGAQALVRAVGALRNGTGEAEIVPAIQPGGR